MKKLLSIICCIAIWQSCRQEEVTYPFPVPFSDLFGRLLVCDSIRTITNASSTLQIVGKGKGRDLMFDHHGKLTIYSNPVKVMTYQIERATKIYYWTPPSSLNTSQFFTIKAMTEKHIQLEESKSADSTFVQYYTIE